MTVFGTPQRNATDDANQGIVNPPTKQRQARTSTPQHTKTLSGTDVAVATMGENLGNALAGMLTEEANNINEQKAIEAQARQGVSSSVNSVDKVKKATGWETAVFGENVEYRAAQQRAVENKVQATYLDQLANISGYAGDTPEQYYARLANQNDATLSQYDDDPDTKQKVANALATSTRKLSGTHYKEHYAYNQQQQQDTERTRRMQTLDQLNLEKLHNLTPEEQTAHLNTAMNLFDDKNKAIGMNPIASRALWLDVIKTHMKAGNSGALMAARAAGYDKNLSAAEQSQWDEALGSYDTKFSQKAEQIRTNANITIAEAVTPDQVQVAANTKEAQLTELFQTSSGTPKSQLVIARGQLDVAKNDADVIKAQTKIDNALQKAQEAAVTDSDKAVIADIGIELEDMRQKIIASETFGEKQEAINQYYVRLGEVGQDLSPAVAAILKKEKLETDGANAQRALDKEMAADRKVADKKLKELKDKATKDDALAEYFQTEEPSIKAGLNHSHAFTKKEKEQGFDTHLLAGAQNFIGGDVPPTAEEYTKALQTDPKLQQWTVQELKRTGETSPVLKNVLTTATQSLDRLYDEDGNVSDVGRQTISMVDKLLSAEKGVALIGGKDAHRAWRITSIGSGNGSGQGATTKKIDSYNANKGKADAAGFTWKSVLDDNQTRQQWMTKKLQNLGIPNPSRQMVTDHLYDYREDLVAFGYDTKEADNSMFSRVTNNKTKIFNSTLADAGYLNDATKWSAQDFITTAEDNGFLAGKYADLSGTSDVINSQRQIPNLRWYTKQGIDGMFATSPSSNNELFISTDEMQDIELAITEQEELQKSIEESRGNIAFKAYEDTQRALNITGKR